MAFVRRTWRLDFPLVFFPEPNALLHTSITHRRPIKRRSFQIQFLCDMTLELLMMVELPPAERLSRWQSKEYFQASSGQCHVIFFVVSFLGAVVRCSFARQKKMVSSTMLNRFFFTRLSFQLMWSQLEWTAISQIHSFAHATFAANISHFKMFNGSEWLTSFANSVWLVHNANTCIANFRRQRYRNTCGGDEFEHVRPEIACEKLNSRIRHNVSYAISLLPATRNRRNNRPNFRNIYYLLAVEWVFVAPTRRRWTG